ncbi:MAG: fused MFS/spermidine synthase, partial [bacterium]|nr:fused MFS/spermidine synthase [bacterium]
VSLTFFMTALLIGYAYSYVLSRFSRKIQFGGHLIVLLAGAISAIYTIPFWRDNHFAPPSVLSPELGLLQILVVAIGLPYFILATTSTLLQFWYAHLKAAKNPYKLYALSNLASWLAIIAYPFLIEPWANLQHMGKIWTIAFLFCLVLIFGCLNFFFRFGQASKMAPGPSIPVRKASIWIGLAFLPTMLLLAVTNEITQAVAPVPFLWLIPLGLYLLSFTLAFSLELGTDALTGLSALLIAAVGALIYGQVAGLSWFVFALLYFVVLFLCSLICHGFLYLDRPEASSLPVFYLLISLGGALGGIFVSLLAPIIFSDFFEVPLALFLSFCLGFFLILRGTKQALSVKSLGVGVMMLAAMVVLYLPAGARSTIKSSRNFYGVLKVREINYAGDLKLRSLYNGDILHGSQFGEGGYSHLAGTTYYTISSGVGLLLSNHTKPRRVGAVGLGVGTIAAYCQEGDFYKFYEINPDVIEVAKNDFSYLKNCKGKTEIALGDARISLELERASGNLQNFDVLVIDAFSDDSIPVHLLTAEAFALYLEHLSEAGVIAIHISNIYLDLAPIIVENARHYGLSHIMVKANSLQHDGKGSIWMLVAANPDAIGSEKLQNAATKELSHKKIRLWTDSYSNILPLLQFR